MNTKTKEIVAGVMTIALATNMFWAYGVGLETYGYTQGVSNRHQNTIVVEKSSYKPTQEDVIQEIREQSTLFGVDTQFALSLAKCESQYDYKAKNPNSTARGVYQYLIGTWEETESVLDKAFMTVRDARQIVKDELGQTRRWEDDEEK